MRFGTAPRLIGGTLSSLLLVTPLLLTTVGCATRPPAAAGRSLVPPEPQREFRAAWVATVGNIDWPSRKGLSSEEQQREIIAILDQAKRMNLNAIVLQVRTSCDAFYPSQYEPWSEYLTGTQGQAPEPFYDPLKVWIDEAHRRGIELHAWFNPYRARAGGARGETSDNHISRTNPDIVKSFNGWQWLDPGEPAAQDLTYNVFLDVVKRYDVDGIHIDDYFYPYPDYLTDRETKQVSDFPDDPSWQRYLESGGKLSRDDWRRHSVDQLIERIYKGIKKTKPWVQFGISPFGIAKPGNPPSVKSGFSQYDKLYADAKLWWNKGWCDYYTPQLYWKVYSPQPYRDLVQWWANENTKGRHLWPGLFTSKWSTQDIIDQVEVTRDTRNATGHVHFSMKAIMPDEGRGGSRRRRRGGDAETQPATGPTTQPATAPSGAEPEDTSPKTLADALARGPYAEQALVPASPWLDDKAPGQPSFDVRQGDGGQDVLVTWEPAGGERAWLWAVYVKHGAAWRVHVYPADTRELRLDPDPVLGAVTAAAVRAVDRSGNQSPAVQAKKVVR